MHAAVHRGYGSIFSMRIELCDLCHKKISDYKSGYSVGRGDLLRMSRLCNSCGKHLEPIIKKIEVAEREIARGILFKYGIQENHARDHCSQHPKNG